MSDSQDDDLHVDAADLRENQAHYFGQVHHADKSAIVLKYRKPFVVVASEKKYRMYKDGYDALAKLAKKYDVPIDKLLGSNEPGGSAESLLENLETRIRGER